MFIQKILFRCHGRSGQAGGRPEAESEAGGAGRHESRGDLLEGRSEDQACGVDSLRNGDQDRGQGQEEGLGHRQVQPWQGGEDAEEGGEFVSFSV